MLLTTPMIWAVLLVAFCVMEGLTAGLVSIWFALGSIAALIAALLGAGLIIQVIAFAVVSLLTMVLIRPLATKLFHPRHEATNADRIIGQEGVVTVTINEIEGTGQVKAGGNIWTARPTGSAVIPAGTHVIVQRIEGVKVIVEPLAPMQSTAAQ